MVRLRKKILGAFEKTFGQGRVLLAATGGEVLEFAALLGGEFGRHFDGHADEELPVCGPAQVRHAFAAEFKDGAILRAGGDFDAGFSVEGGHGDLATEGGGDEGHGNLAEQVVAVAGEDGMLADVDDDIKIAARGTAHAGFAVAAGAEAGAVLDTGGEFEF